MGRELQVLPGVGEEYLASICMAARMWDQHGDQLDDMKRTAEELGRDALMESERMVEEALLLGGISNVGILAEARGTAFQFKVAKAHLAELAVKKIVAATQNTRIDAARKQIRVRVQEAGVNRATYPILDGVVISPEPEIEEEIEPGVVVEGKIYDLRISPTTAGILRIGNKGPTHLTSLTGLADPRTGKARVSMEVLGKAQTR